MRAREALEDGFDLVVIGAAVEHPGVQVGAGMIHEAAEEILHQFGLQIAHHAHAHRRDKPAPAARPDRAPPPPGFHPWAARNSPRG